MKKNDVKQRDWHYPGLSKTLLIMKLTGFFLVIGMITVSAKSLSQNATVTLNMQNSPLSEVFDEIEKQTNYVLFYKKDVIDDTKAVTIQANNEKVKDVLTKILNDEDVTIKMVDDNIIISPETATQQGETRLITGQVTAPTGEALPGVSVLIKGTSIGTITDINGNFQLKASSDNILVFSFIGFKNSELLIGDQNSLKITLSEDNVGMQEVVVVGYGTQKKINLTGAVGNVPMDEIEGRPIANSTNALQGKVAGVYSLQSSGKPNGDGAVINIRGVGTLNNSNPLVLIDGFPGEMSDVSASDISSISVLKDAASAAIYGNRAANGVILITTKQGAPGKMKVTYDGYYGVQEATSLPDVLNSVEYTTLYNEAAINTGMQPGYTDEEIAKYASGTDPMYPDINYFDVYYDKASMQNHRINMNGGSENLQYAFMAGYLNQNGILIANKYKKFDFRSNFDAYFLKDKKLRLSAKLSGNRGETNEPTDEWYAKMYATTAPIWPLKNTEDQWVAVIGERNYYGEIKEGSTRKIMRNTLNSQFEGEFKIINGLSVQATYGYNIVESTANAFHANVTLANLDGSTRKLTSDLTVTDNHNTQSLLTTLLKYQKKFNNHDINFLAGYSEEEFIYNWNSGYRSGFINNTQRVLNLGDASTQSNNAGAYDLGLQSVFGRINYIYADKYLFEANIRKDGCSRFDKEYRWGTFPSFSAGWIISDENFMKGINWLNFLKLRASWGQLGNQNINSYYASSDVLTSGQNYSLGGTLNSGVATTSMANKETTWETTEQTNIGVDISILKDIDITVDYFNKNTSDILMQIPIPLTLGNLSAPYQNVGEVTNKGIEFSARYHHSFTNGMKFSTTLNMAHIVNEVTNLHGRSPIITSPKALVEGYAVNSFYGYKMDGIYQIDDFTWQNNSDPSIPYDQRSYSLKDGVVSVANFTATPGDIKYKDIDGDGTVTMDKDRTVIGKQFPDLTYSLQMNLDWKGFDLGLFLQGVQGIDGYTYYEIATPFSGSANTGAWWKGRWTPENPSNSMPKLTLDGTRNGVHSEFYMEDASYLRVKNIEIGYTLNQNITNTLGIGTLRVYGNIQNALTFTNFKGFDPEQPVGETRAEAYPQVRIYTLGVNVNF